MYAPKDKWNNKARKHQEKEKTNEKARESEEQQEANLEKIEKMPQETRIKSIKENAEMLKEQGFKWPPRSFTNAWGRILGKNEEKIWKKAKHAWKSKKNHKNT